MQICMKCQFLLSEEKKKKKKKRKKKYFKMSAENFTQHAHR